MNKTQQITEYRITYKPGNGKPVGGKEQPGLIAIIRYGHLVDLDVLDFPAAPEAGEIDRLRWKFVEGAMKGDWEGWVDFMAAINAHVPPSDRLLASILSDEQHDDGVGKGATV